MPLQNILEHSRSEEHTSELQSHSENSYAVFCLKKKSTITTSSWYIRTKLSRLLFVLSTFNKYPLRRVVFFFFNDTATTEIYTLSYTLSLHDALPIYSSHIQKSRMPSSACDWS